MHLQRKTAPVELVQQLAEVEYLPPGWRERGMCYGSADEAFFNEYTPSSIEAVREVCESCPVQLECLWYSLPARFIGGIWGGYTTSERQALRTRVAKLRAKKRAYA